MKITEDKLLDYLDGLLDEKEANAVILAIENDKETAKEYHALKKGKEFAEMAHLYDVATAPDPSQQLQKKKILTENKKNWLSWFKFTPSMVPALSACMIMAFIGGSQFNKFYNLSDQDNYIEAENFITLMNSTRSISDYEFEDWSISNDIALNIRSRKNNSEWKSLKNGQNINKGEEIELNIQSIKNNKYLSVEIQINSEQEVIKIIEDKLLIPGNLMKKAFRVNSDEEELKIIFYSKEKIEDTYVKIGSFTFN